MTKPAAILPPAKPDPHDTITSALVAQFVRKAEAGHNLKPDEWRLLLESREQEQVWKDRKECADELGKGLNRVVGVRTLYEWKRQGAPVPTKGPIRKMDMWRWLACEKREAGRPGEQGPAASLREQKLEKEVAILGAKLASLSGAMLDADEARAVVITAMEDIRTVLRHDLPARAVEMAQSKGTEEAAEGIREMIDASLSNLATAAEKFRPIEDGVHVR